MVVSACQKSAKWHQVLQLLGMMEAWPGMERQAAHRNTRSFGSTIGDDMFGIRQFSSICQKNGSIPHCGRLLAWCWTMSFKPPA